MQRPIIFLLHKLNLEMLAYFHILDTTDTLLIQ